MKKNRFFTTLISAVLSLSMIFPLSACDDKGLKLDDIYFYSVYNTYKVKRDEMPAEKEILNADALEITMVQGEYEILQLIMNSKKDVDWYNATISDLVNVENSNIVYKKENVTIAKQEYMYITAIDKMWTGYSAGYYPDALIPMNAIVNYGENHFKAGDNQGLTFQFSTRPELENDIPVLKDGITPEQAKTMSDQEKYTYTPAGTYVGTITVDFKTFTKEIPVTLNISNATVSETVHTKSDYGQRTYKYNAELNWTQQTTDLWNSSIVKYRHMSNRIYTEQSGSQADKDERHRIARELLKRERVSCWAFTSTEPTFDDNFPDDKEWHDQYPNLKGVKSLGTTATMKEFDFWVKASIEDKINYVAKLALKVNCVDEFASHGRAKEAMASGLSLAKMLDYYSNLIDSGVLFSGESLSGLWSAYGAGADEFKAELVQSVKKIQMPVSESYMEAFEEYVKCWCPLTDAYASPALRANYANDDERWWFSFIHDIEGNLIPERVTGWMAAEYDVVGQMDWAIDCFYDKDNSSKMIDDFFTTNILRSNYGNGDGWYFYPAGQYELDELIPSFRMQARLDCFEEWELFYNIKQIYAEISEEIGIDIDPTGVISGLGSNVYNGTTAIQDCANFENTRRALINLSKCTESSARFCILNVEDNGYGKVTYSIYLANENGNPRTLKNHGIAVQPKNAVTGGNVYEIVIDRTSSSSNSIALEFEADGETFVYTQGVGGKVTIVEAQEIGANAFKDGTSEVFASLVETVGTSVQLEGKEVGTHDIEIEVYGQDAADNGEQFVTIYVQSDKISSLFNSSVSQMVVHFHNPTGKVVEIAATGQPKGQAVWANLFTAKLQPGYNSVVLSTKGTNWDKTPLVKMKWKFSNEDGSPMFTNETIYLKDIIVYEV